MRTYALDKLNRDKQQSDESAEFNFAFMWVQGLPLTQAVATMQQMSAVAARIDVNALNEMLRQRGFR